MQYSADMNTWGDATKSWDRMYLPRFLNEITEVTNWCDSNGSSSKYVLAWDASASKAVVCFEDPKDATLYGLKWGEL